jgi:hypothetical protein
VGLALAASATLGDALRISSTVASHTDRIIASSLLQLLSAATAPAIAVAFFPIVRARSETLAIAAVAFRAVEGAFYGVAALLLLAILAAARSSGAPSLLASLSTMRDSSNFVAGVVFYALGALSYYWVLHRYHLVPRLLTWWGFAGVTLILGAALATLMNGQPYTISGPSAGLAIPIALQELTLGGWLITRGVRASTD